MKNASRVLTFAFAVALLSSAAYADPQAGSSAPSATPAATSGTASGGTTPRRHGPCRADVQNFCSNVPKGNGKVLDCLKAHVGQLSTTCEAAMKRHANQPAASTTPVSAPPAATNGATPSK